MSHPRGTFRTAIALRKRLQRAAISLAVAALGTTLLATPGYAANPATPGNYNGYGFDQCQAPSQSKMDTWLNSSPYLAVGIYISGDSRGCRNQTYLNATWVATQLTKGWRLLPITLGPQASCSDHFPRYGDDETINPRRDSAGRYSAARRQGVLEANKTINNARALGISVRSTLWYDIESFDITQTACRESALNFLHGWVNQIENWKYVSGVYSSASTGIKMLDDARRTRPGAFNLPTNIWFARWDGKANTATTYFGNQGWNPHRRVKQYRGGHNETWGGVTINIDSNWLDVGRGNWVPRESAHCGGAASFNFPFYETIGPDTTYNPNKVKALQCLLKDKGIYRGVVHGRYDTATVAATNVWKRRLGKPANNWWTIDLWKTLLSAGTTPVVKRGSSGTAIRRVQRTLNASQVGHPLTITGIFDPATVAAMRAYQQKYRQSVNGVANPRAWLEWQKAG